MDDATTVERLDFSKPPPWYYVIGKPDSGWWWTERVTGEAGLTPSWPSPEEALAAAWAHYKARHDPPGLGVGWRPSAIQWMTGQSYFDEAFDPDPLTPAQERARAWAWYARRLALVLALEDVGLQLPLWPAALSWTEDNGDCEACESWLKRGPSWEANDFPTVLKAIARPCGPHCDCEAMGHG